MLKFLILLPLIFTSFQSNAVTASFGSIGKNIKITPIVGYEQVQKLLPTPHTKNRFFYGIGLEFGPQLFSMELQVTQAEDTETYISSTIKETSQQASVGLKSSFALNSSFSFYLRAGAQGKKSEIETTESGVTTTEKSAFYIDPYFGTGINISLAKILNISMGITAVFTDYPNQGETEYRTNLGFGIHF